MKDLPQDNLSKLLHEWELESDLPPRFNERVWRKIDTTRKQPVRVRPGFAAWIQAAFGRPAVAASYLLVLTAIGLTSGLYKASRENHRLERSAQASYLQLVDPYHGSRIQ